MTFSFDISKADKLEAPVEQTFIPLSEPEKITELEERMTHVATKGRNLSMYVVIYRAYLGSTSGHQKAGSIRPRYIKRYQWKQS